MTYDDPNKSFMRFYKCSVSVDRQLPLAANDQSDSVTETDLS